MKQSDDAQQRKFFFWEGRVGGYLLLLFSWVHCVLEGASYYGRGERRKVKYVAFVPALMEWGLWGGGGVSGYQGGNTLSYPRCMYVWWPDRV